MANIRLRNIFLGYNDGKKEALYRGDFENFFFDYDNIYEKLKSHTRYLVLGRKGSGKSYLAECYKKKESDSNHVIEIKSFKEFRFHELVNLKSSDTSPNEYISIWEWVVLLDFAQYLAIDETIDRPELKRKIAHFFEQNYKSIEVDSKKIIEITQQNKISGTILSQGIEDSVSHSRAPGNYLEYLESLRDVVFELVSLSSIQYTIIYDELDDRFKDDVQYKNSLISFVKAVDKLNLAFLELHSKSKSVLLLRSDIFSILNDPDLNKIRRDNSVVIDWGNKVEEDSPLLKMILIKTRKSIPETADLSDAGLYRILFPQNVKGIEPNRFILERTFFRPRDIVTMLNIIIERYPETQYFGWKALEDSMPEYSEYFYQEVRNELSGHIPDAQIDQGTLLLKQFNRYEFSFDQIKEFYNSNKSVYNQIDLESILRIFFKFSIIGNKWFNDMRQKNYYSWSYRDNKAEIDFRKNMIVHLGLRIELSM